MDKTAIVELCDQIKRKLVEQGREHLILRKAATNDAFEKSDIDIECRDFDDEEDTYNDWGMDCETRLISYDCGGYSRTLQMDGIAIEDDVLKFYLTEVEMSCEGDEDIDTYYEDIEGLLDEECWWMSGGDPEFEFRPEEVLDFYLKLLTGDDYFTLPPVGELKKRREE